MTPETVQVLLVEDDDVDAEAVLRGFRQCRIVNPVHRVNDGVEALDALRGTGAFDAPFARPYVVLLDLNLPRMNGIDFLQAVREDERLHDSIVFVLTTSRDDRDLTAAYANNVAGYIVKSRVGEDFIGLVSLFANYWRIVELPS